MTPHGHNRGGVLSVVAGVVVASLVAAGAAALLATRPQQWSAASSLLVIPQSADNPDLVAGLYDALSQGQVPATYAELLRDRSLEVSQAQQQGLSAEETLAVSLEIVVVPETSVLDLTVTAPRPGLAEAMAGGVLTEAVSYLSGLNTPYTVVAAGEAAGTARRDGLAPLPLAAVVAAVALLAGLAVQQAVSALRRARGVRAEPDEASTRPVPVTIVSGPPPETSPPRRLEPDEHHRLARRD